LLLMVEQLLDNSLLMLDFFKVVELIGIVAFTISAFSISINQRLDILGLFIIAFLNALGGGVIRDIIVDRLPNSFIHIDNVIVVIFSIFIGVLLGVYKKDIDKNRLFILSDAIGLVSFAISGALIGIEANFTIFGVAFIALITAVGGGVMRDILLNQIPLLLKSDFYGSIAIVVGSVIYGLDFFHLLNNFSLIVLFVLAFSLRILAYELDWHLPKIG